MSRNNTISERKRYQVSEWSWDFKQRKNPGSGMSFECDNVGNITIPADNLCAWENLIKCIQQISPYHDDLIDCGVVEHKHWQTDFAILKCWCGREVTLTSFTNTCECGTDYNLSGQQLACRSQWGEETGETAADILNYDYVSQPKVEY